MGLTFKELVGEFISGASSGMSGGQANLKISESKLIHYETIIAERYNDKFIVNVTYYSIETGRLQKIILDLIPGNLLVKVKGIPQGYMDSLIPKIET